MNQKTQKMVVMAIFIGLATVLSEIPILKMPFGGSVTLFSMLPIAMISIGYGLKSGFVCSFLYALAQLALGLTDVLSWGLTPIVLLSCFFVDYIFAFTAIGLSGIFRKKGLVGICSGIALALSVRFVFHLFSGVVLFASWTPEEFTSPIIYSVLYNGAYMLPEIVITMIGAVLLFKAPVVNKVMLADMQSI